jgi:gluconokinase
MGRYKTLIEATREMVKIENTYVPSKKNRVSRKEISIF